jgi:RNA polymerase sigma-70 factor (ECF subfamily)
MQTALNLIVNHFKKIKKMPLYRETEEFSDTFNVSDDSLSGENKIIYESSSNR